MSNHNSAGSHTHSAIFSISPNKVREGRLRRGGRGRENGRGVNENQKRGEEIKIEMSVLPQANRELAHLSQGSKLATMFIFTLRPLRSSATTVFTPSHHHRICFWSNMTVGRKLVWSLTAFVFFFLLFSSLLERNGTERCDCASRPRHDALSGTLKCSLFHFLHFYVYESVAPSVCTHVPVYLT